MYVYSGILYDVLTERGVHLSPGLQHHCYVHVHVHVHVRIATVHIVIYVYARPEY